MIDRGEADSMLKVIFVDDEPIIREGLREVIDWNEYGFEVIGTAENGQKGLDMIRLHQPDLAFVDIKMPKLNGIDMAGLAKKNGYRTKFVILSGYSQFSYAQKAIQLGMESYLLKPIDEEELIPLVEEIAQKCKEERVWSLRKRKYERYEIEDAWKKLFVTKRISSKLEELYQNVPFQIVSVKDFKNRDREQIRSILQHYFSIETQYIWFEEHMYVIIQENVNEYNWGRIAVEENLQVLALDETIKLDQAVNYFERIKKLHKITFHYGNKMVLTPKDIVAKEYTELKEDFVEKIINCLQFQDDERLQYYFLKYETYCKRNHFSKERTKADMIDTLKTIYIVLKSEHFEIQLPNNEEVFPLIYGSSHLQEMLERVRDHLLQLSQEVNIFINPEDLTERMIGYTKHYYYKELSLKTMAELFNYNPSYLGKKFKKETGEYFHHFLDNVRIEKAKELLLERQWKVYEISEKIGYSNHDYFYKKFKKQTGMSPREYQKSVKKGGISNGQINK